MHSIAEIFEDLLIFIVVIFALSIGLIVVVSKLPHDNPLHRILSALTIRVVATLGVGLVAIPVEIVPGIDVLYDVAAPIGLIWFWYRFFKDALRIAHPRKELTIAGKGALIEHNSR